MNCAKCQYLKLMTKNPRAVCFKHGMGFLLARFEKQSKTLSPAEQKQLRLAGIK